MTPEAKWWPGEDARGPVYWPANREAVGICERQGVHPARPEHLAAEWGNARMLHANGQTITLPRVVEMVV